MVKWAEDKERLSNVIDDSHAKMEDDGRKIQKESVPKRSWMRKFELCKPEMKGEVAVHLGAMDAAWWWLSCNSFSH